MDLADCIAPTPVIFSSIFYERSEMKILQLQQHLHQVKCRATCGIWCGPLLQTEGKKPSKRS
jgi:hypothetical protein